MKKFTFLFLLIALTPTNVRAQVFVNPTNPITITQSNAVNVSTVIEIGNEPVTVNQTGAKNYAVVIEISKSPTATINQTGTVINSATIIQRGVAMNATVTQAGATSNNRAFVSQGSGIGFVQTLSRH